MASLPGKGGGPDAEAARRDETLVNALVRPHRWIIDNGEYVRQASPIREGFRRSYTALLDRRALTLDRLALTRRPVLVFTVYNPCFHGHGFDAAYQQAAESAVSIINDVIQQEARRRSFEILEFRTLFDDRADYANPIEPSAIGGAKLAKCMSGWVKLGSRCSGRVLTLSDPPCLPKLIRSSAAA